LIPNRQPSNCVLGHQVHESLAILREFIESLDFIHMQPDRSAVAIPPHPGGCYALLKPGESVDNGRYSKENKTPSALRRTAQCWLREQSPLRYFAF
jgi:hypothetical protein